MSETTMKRCNFFLPPVLLAALQEKTKETKVPMSEYVRQALAEFLKVNG
jgi:hypothetical protein